MSELFELDQNEANGSSQGVPKQIVFVVSALFVSNLHDFRHIKNASN